jgi:hypothetical protein
MSYVSSDQYQQDETFEDCCVVCGDPHDYCQGHGVIGDPIGHRIQLQHDEGDHSECFAKACQGSL